MGKIDEMRAVERAATPGPWELDALGAMGDVKILSPWIEDAWTGDAEAAANMEFIAHARQYVPWSFYEIDRLTAELAIAQREAAQAQKERDAAVGDLAEQHLCATCAFYGYKHTDSPCCACSFGKPKWQWRGMEVE